MSDARYPRLLAKALTRRARPEPRPANPALCGDEIELVQETLGQLARRRRARVVAGSCVALLAIGGLTLPRLLKRATTPSAAERPEPALAFVASASSEGTTIVSGDSSVALDAERPLQPGSRLVVGPVAGANVFLSTGSRLAVEPGSEVTVTGQGRAAIFDLGVGSLRADVAKLAPSERFLVRTRDSEVEVRGTSFRVSVVLPDPECGEGTTTHVKVYEGTVVVRRNGHEESVDKGEDWPRGCTQALAPRPTPVAAAPPGEVRADVGRAPPRSPAHVETSNLGAQNDQFADAMIIKRRGDKTAAIAAFDRFLATHPTSYLAENAAVERMKLLAGVDRAAARAAARQYLQKYPSGFAVDDARALLAGSARTP